MNTKALYMDIYNDILNKITSGKYKHNEFLPAERTLSENYNVQRPTIRHALDLLVQNNYIVKIQGAGNKVIYNNIDQNPLKPNVIVYVIPNSNHQQPYHLEICSHLEKLCSEKNLSLVFTKSRVINNVLPQWFYSPNVIGAIFVSQIDESLLQAAKHSNLPSILFCNPSDLFPKVNLDDMGAGYMATTHLIECGCKHIAHISGRSSYYNTEKRKEGYKIALKYNNLPVNEKYIANGDWSYESGYNGTKELLSSYPEIDGIFAANDLMAIGAINAAFQKGYSIPKDIKIIGIDNIKDSENSVVPLTTISLSQKDSANMLFMTLNRIFRNRSTADEIVIPPKLIIRKSTIEVK